MSSRGTNTLHPLLRQRNWNAIRERLDQYPEEARRDHEAWRIVAYESIPWDIYFSLGKLVGDFDSIYDFPFFLTTLETNFDTYIQYEVPTEDVAARLVVEAIEEDMRDLALKILNHFSDLLFHPQIIMTSVHTTHTDEDEEGSFLNQLLRLGMNKKLRNLRDLDNPQCRQAIVNTLLSYKDADDEYDIFIRDHFFGIFFRTIMGDHPDICRHLDIVQGLDLMKHCIALERVDLVQFLVRHCPNVLCLQDSDADADCHHERSIFHYPFLFKRPRVLSTLLGIDVPADDVNLYPNHANVLLKSTSNGFCPLASLIIRHATVESEDIGNIVDCLRLCDAKFHRISYQVIFLWINAMFRQERNLISVHGMRIIMEKLDIRLSSVHVKIGVTYAMACLQYVMHHVGLFSLKDTSKLNEVRQVFSLLLLDEEHIGRQLASAVMPDGHLPLHMTCLLGMQWSMGMDIIYERYPDAIGVADTRTGLVPFLLAACTHRSNLNSVYELLRSQPSVLDQLFQ